MICTYNLWGSNELINATATITSNSVSTLHARGFYSILIILSGTTPSVNVVYEVSKDASTFYAPIDGNSTDLSSIIAGLDATKWVTFSIGVVTPHLRIKITGTGTNGVNTYAQAYLFFQEEVLI